MKPITVPTVNSNDTDALLVSWAVNDGEMVRVGETIAVLETTKATFEVPAEADGLLRVVALIHERCKFGSVIGYIFEDAEEGRQFVAIDMARNDFSDDETKITNSARELITQYGITNEQIHGLRKKVIKVSDLESLLPKESGLAPLMPSIQQQSIARLVSRSRETIADSFLVKRINVDPALDLLGQFSRDEKVMVGLPDLLVLITARLSGNFPFFFGNLDHKLCFFPATKGNVGVTFDLGNGLFIPVVQNAAHLALKDIAKQMMGFRLKAVRNGFRAEEFANADLSISINMDTDVIFVQPVIPPGQTCMLSLNAVFSEVVADAGGEFVARRCVYLGVAFDHRVINGYEANAFANSIKKSFENPQPASWC